MLFVVLRAVPDTIQTHKRFKRTQCIRTKHSMRILGVIPLIKLQNNTPTNRLFCSFRKGIAPKIPMLCFFVLIKKNIILNIFILCVLILFQNADSRFSFRS